MSSLVRRSSATLDASNRATDQMIRAASSIGRDDIHSRHQQAWTLPHSGGP